MVVMVVIHDTNNDGLKMSMSPRLPVLSTNSVFHGEVSTDCFAKLAVDCEL